MPQLMQLEEGLRSCGVLDSMREHPQLWEKVFHKKGPSEDLTADDFLDQLVANFSAGQREKEREIDVYKIFCDFLQAVDRGEGGYFLIDYIIYYCYVIYSSLIKILGMTQ